MVPINSASFLVVDDSETMRRIVRGMLTEMGALEISEASNGELALVDIKRRGFTIIISDWHMLPMSGLALLQATTDYQKPKLNRFIFMTTEGTWGRKTTAKSEGADGFVVKPFQISRLYEVVRTVLQRM